jgi:uncharacterized membrane protein HdeD (DUF308 family)
MAGHFALVAAILFGVYLLITGIAQVIFAFALDGSAGSRILLFISGRRIADPGGAGLPSFR